MRCGPRSVQFVMAIDIIIVLCYGYCPGHGSRSTTVARVIVIRFRYQDNFAYRIRNSCSESGTISCFRRWLKNKNIDRTQVQNS